jgi:hypothetical protein
MDKVLTIAINQVFKFVTSHMRVTIGGIISHLVVSPLSTNQNLQKKTKFQKAWSPCSLKISDSILTWMLFNRIVNRRNKQIGVVDDSTHIQLWNSIETMFSLFEGCFIIWFMFTFFKGYIVTSLLPL